MSEVRPDRAEFIALLEGSGRLESTKHIEKIAQYRDLVLQENAVQNLTRLTSPQEFFDGHVLDCLELVEQGVLQSPVMDLGSGVGVPGIICAILEDRPWILAESEGLKAKFLQRVTKELGLSHVTVFQGRAEDFLRQHRVGSIVARAVGTVERIYGWIGTCSTWNKLILLKGPGWEEEWVKAKGSKASRALHIERDHPYTAGKEARKLRIVSLVRA